MSDGTQIAARRALALSAVALALSLGAAGAASADVGALAYRGCLTSAASSTASCEKLASGTLDGLTHLVVSPDGRSLYGAAHNGHAIAMLSRDPADGAVAYGGCIGSDSDVSGCAMLAGAVSGGINTPLSAIETLGVSPDGLSLYATSSEGLSHFRRDPTTGALAYAGCISGRSGSACTQLPGSTATGAGTGLGLPRSPVVSADGRNLYLAAYGGTAVSHFTRDPGSGTVSYVGCISGNTNAACTHIPGATSSGGFTGLSGLAEIALSADGRSLYAAASSGDAITRFAVGPTGALTHAGCLTSNTGIAQCDELPGATSGGNMTPLGGPASLAIGPDDRHVYVLAGDGTVVALNRDRATGALAFASCVSGVTAVPGCVPTPGASADGGGSGLGGPRLVRISGDGRDLYVAAEQDSSVARLVRDPASGALTFAGCQSGDPDVGACATLPTAGAGVTDSGLYSVEALTVSPDGRNVYTSGHIGDSLTRFDRELPPAPPAGPAPPATRPPATSCATVTARRAVGLDRRQRPRKRRAGVRVRVTLDRPGELRISARLIHRRAGRRRVVALRTATARARPRATLRLRVPARARLRRGARVKLRIAIRARGSGTACRYGRARVFTVRAKVV